MQKNSFFERNISEKLMSALKRSPVVLLTGARQTGKTFLMKNLLEKQGYNYITFDDLKYLNMAKKDPIGFIANRKTPIILDEIQRVPEIFLTIKHFVDKSETPGMFALTGSANPLLIPKLGDSLAGRMEILNLFPLSQGEILGKKEIFIDCLFSNKISQLKESNLSLEDLCNKIIVGGYPRTQNKDMEERHSWFHSYLTTMLQRDVKDLSRIEGLSQLSNLLDLISTRVGGLLNISELSRTSKISYATLNRYMILLKTLFLVLFLKPWQKNLGKRLVKSPKLYLLDSGFLLFLLNCGIEKLMEDPNLFGHVFENFVICEVLKQSSWSKFNINTFHYRTQGGVEVDFIVQNHKGQIVGVEIKSSQFIKQDDFRGLRNLQESTSKNFSNGIVLYTGNQKIQFEKNMWALPVGSMWS